MAKGKKSYSQPGGGPNKPTMARSVKTVVAPPRLGPAGKGNKPLPKGDRW